MKQKCLRCLVQLSLDKVSWQDGNQRDVHLNGAPVFLRACVLGQLQHSHLHRPLFPLTLDQELQFDRVLTNCRNPSLFSEVIRGEHIKFELIQITSDYKGGKILARFEAPAHKFLFPAEPANSGELRQVQLTKKCKPKCPPVLTFATSTTLLETTVHSPIDSLLAKASDDASTRSSGREIGSSKQLNSEGPLPGVKNGGLSLSDLAPLSPSPHSRSSILYENPALRYHSAPVVSGSSPVDKTHSRLHQLLSSYSEPGEHAHSLDQSSRPSKVKFKPPVPTFSKPHSSHSRERSPVSRYGPTPTGHRPSSTHVEGCHDALGSHHGEGTRLSFYKSLTSMVGPHHWEHCPRRCTPEKRTRSHSAPGSPIAHRRLASELRSRSRPTHHRSYTIPNHVPLAALDLGGMDTTLRPRETIPNLKPPFVVRQVDSKLLSRRDFCGLQCSSKVEQYSWRRKERREGGRRGRSEEMPHSPPPSGVQYKLCPLHTPSIRDSHSASEEENPTSVPPPSPPLYSRPKPSHSYEKYLGGAKHRLPDLLSRSSGGERVKRQLYDRSSKTTTGSQVSSWSLMAQPGNTRAGVMSPSKLIEEKLQRLREECCMCEHSAESVAEDSLSEDLERLRASLAAEREETLNRSSQFIPDKSVMVKIGPQDYWSQRMAEFTGRPHRLLFDEMLEKIYHRLYGEASAIH